VARKTLPIRTQVIAMLQTPGVKHTDIAAALHCSTRTVARISQEVARDLKDANDRLATLNREITKVVTVRQRAEKYANLATKAKNEAVSLAALQRIDDLEGIVTQKELVRTRQGGLGPEIQPMFMLPAGSQVNVTVTTTSSNKDASSEALDYARDVTPKDAT
jgi:hypothetical protein